ncbi:MAG: class I SAM-dependent methyltransferase [Bryobacteraceae bacterium]|nr:class I SAM-dependent methyltransferase [Bryobacteraceae bacterium]
MSITADQERAFYDDQYARHLALPEHALRLTRATLERTIDDPAQPMYERRRLYRATIAALLEEPVRGRKALDYGCGPGDFGLLLATEGAEVTFLDLSPAAIELCLRRAAASGVAARGVAADASRLEAFAAGEFDLVFAAASLHHTLKYPGALEELARVMKPGARLVLCETWGGNPVLNVARRVRAWLAREPAEQGEEILLGEEEIGELRRYFERIELRPLSLTAMAKRLARGRFTSGVVRGGLRVLESVDGLLLGLAPRLGRWCGEVVVVARRRGHAT